MDGSRIALYASIAVILTVTVLSGPAVGLVDLTTPRFGDNIGQGNATVEEVDAPTTARLDRGFQSESYTLKVPDARIYAAAIDGQPVVSYRISIPEMGYSRSTAHFVGPEDTGWVELSITGDTLAQDRVAGPAYNGTISVIVRGTDEHVVYEGNVTVEVRE